MRYVVPILLFFLFVSPQQPEKYPLKRGKPTTRGINYYVEVNKYKLIDELETYLNDSIFLDVEISTDDISQYSKYDSLDMAYHFTYTDGSDEIIIDNRERYVAYDVNDLSKFKRLNLSTYNSFVKTAIIHELMHTYFLQIVIISKFNGVDVYDEYDYRMPIKIRLYPNIAEAYGAEFIEEGVCQYVVEDMKLIIPYRVSVPKTVGEVMGNNEIKYTYSIDYLKEFLDYFGVRKGIEIIIRNKPPTYEEILNPDLYFNRLN